MLNISFSALASDIMKLAGKVYAVGYGETPVSRARVDKGETKLSLQDYLAWAAELAIADAGLEKKDLEGQGLGVTGSAFPHSEIYSAEVVQDLGLSPGLLMRGDHGGASGASLLHQASLAMAAGEVELVLCLGADTPLNITTPGAVRTWRYESDFQKPFGMMGPNSQFAFILRRHMHQFGTKAEALGKVAVIQRDHAAKNLNGYLKTPLTMEQYLASRMIADPIRMFDACIQVNGGLAVLLASREKAKQLAEDKRVAILAIAEDDNYQGVKLAPDMTYLGIAASAKRAFEDTDIRQKQVDFFQPYDDYTIAVIMQLEDAGFCKKGEGGKFVEETDISYKGALPINTGGGQLSAGQPGMAGGLVHIVESIRQLRGEGGERQVKDARVGVATGIGAISYGNSLVNSATMIFGKE